MERSAIRGVPGADAAAPDYASLHPGYGFQQLLPQPEPQRRNSKEGEEADDVGDRCHERAGGDGRIGPDTFERHRDQDAAERAGEEVHDDGEPDDHAEAWDPEPGHRSDSRDHGKGETIDEADQ